jgi:membrane fusion protein, multidrug efflux system
MALSQSAEIEESRDGLEPAPGPAPRRPWYRRRHVLVAGAAVLLALLAGGGVYYHYATGFESTNDAFIDGEIVRISPRVSGHVERVAVTDNQLVESGQTLVELDRRPFAVALEQARARATAADAEARRGEADAARARELYARQLIARAALDEATARARTTAAQLDAARADVRRAELDLGYTVIGVPQAGRVTRKSVEEGMFVQVGQPLLTIVTGDLWVVANFKETQLRNLRPGEPVEIRVDAFPGRVFRGRVDSTQRGTGARFSLLPPENATGNYVKVVQRVPVKIVFDEPPDPQYPLGPGMSVVPRVAIR